jgi:hypothetical protein
MTAAGRVLFSATRRRWVVVLSLVAATAAALLALYRPSLQPLGLHSRSLEISAASTELLVGSERSLPTNSNGYAAADNRAVLAGNVLVSPAVTGYVATRLGIEPQSVEVSAPVTANIPAALIEPGGGGGPTDILKLPDRYELEVQADPTVPVLFVYALGPSGARAVELANVAARGLVRYLAQTQRSAGIPAAEQLTVEQIGTAQGGTAHTDGLPQIALLVFAVVLAASLLLLSAIAGRAGWPARIRQPGGAATDSLRKMATYSSE